MRNWYYFLCFVTFISATALFLAACSAQPYTIGGIHRCKQAVFVIDKLTGQTRKLVRYEIHDGIPGTGVWGVWVEHYCQKPHAKTWVYKIGEWPRPISEKEVRRLLGDDLFEYFKKNVSAKVSCYYNLTGIDGYVDSGVCKDINVITIRKR